MEEDAETRFKALLQPIRDLASNWEVDVAETLENYLEDLEHVRLSLDGKTDLNFAEAALLIQGSTAIYSKKVEYLHQLVLQALELITTQRKNADASKAGDEQGNNANGKAQVGKKASAAISIMDDERFLFGADPSFLLLDDVVEQGANIDLAGSQQDVRSQLEKRRSSVSNSHTCT